MNYWEEPKIFANLPNNKREKMVMSTTKLELVETGPVLEVVQGQMKLELGETGPVL